MLSGAMVDAGALLAGGLLGVLFQNHIRERFLAAANAALSMVILTLGICSAVETENLLCMILCMVLGSVLGEGIRLDQGLERMGETMRRILLGDDPSGSRFTEGLVTTSILLCIGSLAITGSLQAGAEGDCSILYAKSVLDGVSAVVLGASMGMGVPCAAVILLAWEGGLTLAAGAAAPWLSPEAIREMSAVGGVIVIASGINFTGLAEKTLPVATMLPAIFLPVLYIPLETWMKGLLA